MASTLTTADSRSIIIRAGSNAGLSTAALERVGTLQGVEWSAGFGTAQDARNAAFEDGARVPIIEAWSADWSILNTTSEQVGDPYAPFILANGMAATQLGLASPGGVVTSDGVQEKYVRGPVEFPEYLNFLGPVLLLPQEMSTELAPLQTMVLIVADPIMVSPVAQTVRDIIGVRDPASVTVETSGQLVELQRAVDGQLHELGRELTAYILLAVVLVCSLVMTSTVLLRRRDFGRRRALGATRQTIIALFAFQAVSLALVAAVLGLSLGCSILLLTRAPLPGMDYLAALLLNFCFVAFVSSVLPGVVAATRQPARELRVA